MPTHTVDLSTQNYYKYLNKNRLQQEWTLCLGAGICKGILPDWYELTNRLVNRCFNYSWTTNEFKTQSDLIGYSLDSWIQGCLNHHIFHSKGNVLTFNQILEDELYHDLLINAENCAVKELVIRVFDKPEFLKYKDILKVCEFFDSNYANTTLMKIVNTLTEASDKISKPNSIVTFNADCLLYSLLTVYNIKKHSIGKSTVNRPKTSYKRITKPFQTWSDKIPIFHLHGSISPSLKVKKMVSDSRDNLIFLESSYTKVAGSMFSWAQSNFLYLAQNNKLVFLGLSMTDPNIRRWLSWTTDNYNSELHKQTNSNVLSLKHLWIKPRMNNAESQNFIDVSLHHLSVKIGLIEKWGDIGHILNHLMAN